MMNVNLGIRKLTPVNGAFVMNIPIVAVRTLDLKAYDRMNVILQEDGSLKIKKDKGDINE